MKKLSIIYLLVAAGLILMTGCGGGVSTSADG